MRRVEEGRCKSREEIREEWKVKKEYEGERKRRD